MNDYDKIWINTRIVQVDENNEVSVKDDMFIAIKDKKIAKIANMQSFDGINCG